MKYRLKLFLEVLFLKNRTTEIYRCEKLSVKGQDTQIKRK